MTEARFSANEELMIEEVVHQFTKSISTVVDDMTDKTN